MKADNLFRNDEDKRARAHAAIAERKNQAAKLARAIFLSTLAAAQEAKAEAAAPKRKSTRGKGALKKQRV